MKAILISIKPKWVSKILNGEKTIEIRKTMPKYDLPIDVYIYCTKDKSRDNDGNVIGRCYPMETSLKVIGGKGKVVAKFTLNRCRRIWNTTDELFEKSCLTEYEFYKYANKSSDWTYAWYISNLVIFDKPKELREFYKIGAWKVYNEQLDSSYMKKSEQEIMKSLNQTLTKAPQSYCYIEVE